jgi:multidrug efflux system membrane fusion protein
MDGDQHVKIRPLKVGPNDENSTVVTEGLAAGDRVVLEGTDRLKDGGAVEVVGDSKDVPVTPEQKLHGKPGKGSGEPAADDAPKKGSV